jgi:RNA polymerase sigma-70 factor (ECF subfamily)
MLTAMQVPITQAKQDYSRIVRGLEPDVLRHALRLSKDLDWAHDLVQDAFIAGYPLFLDGSLNESGNLKGWFTRVVTNRFINEFKRRNKWTSDTSVEDADVLKSGHRAEVDSEIERMLSEPLEAALAQLSVDHRLCVLLVDVSGMDYVQAAQTLEIPVGTVRSRLARARLKLYALLLPYAKSRGYVQP